WVLNMMTPSVYFLFPFLEEMNYVEWVDELPKDVRRRGVDYYVGMMRRHMYATGPHKTLLNKNVFFASRIEAVTEQMPETRYVYMVRHPYEAVPSFISMFSKPWQFHSPEIGKDSPEARAFGEVVIDFYYKYERFFASFPKDRVITIHYDELVADPKATVQRIYDFYGYQMSSAMKERLESAVVENSEHRSEHEYTLEDFGLTREYIYERLGPIFEKYGFSAEGPRRWDPGKRPELVEPGQSLLN
ncbi:MAG: sulfotransferase, partial [Phycisphaerales bacterium]|nr:sulfotransferase [Phycisphaerales bacterium]